MIKNLIFDFGKVLVDYEYFETLDQIFKTHEQAEEFYHLLIDGNRIGLICPGGHGKRHCHPQG